MVKIKHTGKGYNKLIPSLEEGVKSYKAMPTFEKIQVEGKLKELEFLADPHNKNLIPSLKKTTPYEQLNVEITLSVKQVNQDRKNVPVTTKIESLEKLAKLVKLTNIDQHKALKEGFLVWSGADLIYPEGFDVEDFSNYANPNFFVVEKNEIIKGPKIINRGKWSVAYNLFSELRKTRTDEFQNYELHYVALRNAIKGINLFGENIIGNGTEESVQNYKHKELDPDKKIDFLTDKIFDYKDNTIGKIYRNLDLNYKRMAMMFPNEWENIEPLLQEQISKENDSSFNLNGFRKFIKNYFS